MSAPYTPPPPPPAKPTEELKEAVDHLRKAAELFLDRASKDPAVQYAKEGATEVLRKLGESAQPLAGAAAKAATDAAGETDEVLRRVSGQAEPTARKVAELTGTVASEASRAILTVAGKLAGWVEARRPGSTPPEPRTEPSAGQETGTAELEPRDPPQSPT